MSRELRSLTENYHNLVNRYHTLLLQYLDSVIDPSKPNVREEWNKAAEELEVAEKELKKVLGIVD